MMCLHAPIWLKFVISYKSGFYFVPEFILLNSFSYVLINTLLLITVTILQCKLQQAKITAEHTGENPEKKLSLVTIFYTKPYLPTEYTILCVLYV